MRTRVIICLLAVALVLSAVAAIALRPRANPAARLYQPSEVAEILTKLNAGIDNVSEEVRADLLLPTSMGIKTPKLNMSRIAKTVLLSDLNPVFIEDLKAHGVKVDESMTLSDYEAIEATWMPSAETVESYKRRFPELANVDTSKWTMGKYQAYSTEADKKSLADRFSAEQLQELARRGILVEDTFYLFKEFHNPETMLAQSDETLKSVIEGYYQFSIDMTIGAASAPK